jgi:MoaA/NifB/PqqE/SkfB family radical SAM enzyme
LKKTGGESIIRYGITAHRETGSHEFEDNREIKRISGVEKTSYGHIEIPLKRVHIELTNICDFNCVFCPKSEMARPFGYMETDLAKRIITEVGKDGIGEKVTFHVMGEPTLHRDFFEILDHARRENVKVGLTTNGAGLGGEKGIRLLDYDLHQVDVSLQTPDEKSFELRKSGVLSFEDYLKGIMDFFSLYSAKGRDTTFKFRFLNTRFRKRGMEKKTGPLNVMSSTDELRLTFRQWGGKIYDALGVDGIYNAWAGYCFGMRDHFSVLYNGDVILCCIDFNGHTTLGNLHTTSLKEILSSDELGRIINGFKKFRPVHPYCRRCLGSKSVSSWLFKPLASVMALKVLRPFFYKKIRVFD